MEIETVCADDMLPVRAHEADAGADLKAARDVAIRRGDTAKVSTGVRVSIPEGCFGLLAARSSLCGRGLMMLNGVGIIDSGYTGVKSDRTPLLAERQPRHDSPRQEARGHRRGGVAMSRKTFCDMCGAEIKGNSAKVVVISAEYEDLYGCISSDDAMDACDEYYTRIREAIKECRERGRHGR